MPSPSPATSRGNHRRITAAALGAVAMLGHSPTAPAQDRSGSPMVPEPVVYTILPAGSLLQVHTYKAGILGGLGHEHDIRAHAYTGSVVYDTQDPSRSRVSLTVPTESLLVVIADDSSDIPEITAAMRQEVLHVDRFPEISFASTEVTVRDSTLHLRGNLTMVGVTRPVEMDLAFRATPEILQVDGSFTIKQTDFGIRPYSTALGTVKVKNEITFILDIRALAAR